MKYAVNAAEMKKIDSYTIEKIGIPSLVLMERAALSVVHRLQSVLKNKDHIAVICGTGNNGGDGIAIARILHINGYQVDIYVLGNVDKQTVATKEQISIARNLGMAIRSNFSADEYNIIIDAIFGIGLERDITGEFEEIIKKINESNAFVVAVDIPSGVNATNGKIMNVAVNADMTVTFGENKLGMILYPGASVTGTIFVEDIGFPNKVVEMVAPKYCYYDSLDMKRLPARFSYSNKGSYGKVLIIAGSEWMTGAAYLSAKAAYRMGCGLVKVLTSNAGVEVIRSCLPEALYASYEQEEMDDIIRDSIRWASTIVIGPGLGKGERAKIILSYVLKECKVPLIIDADAIKLIAMELNKKNIYNRENRIKEISEMLPKDSVLTPHLKELSELLACQVTDITGEFIDIPEQCTYNSELTYVIKDTRTIVSQRNNRYINVSGNHGMATGGSGDVLSGIIAGLMATGLGCYEAATLGVYIHGLAGDRAAEQKGYHSMLASDIIEALPEVIKDYEGRSIQGKILQSECEY